MIQPTMLVERSQRIQWKMCNGVSNVLPTIYWGGNWKSRFFSWLLFTPTLPLRIPLLSAAVSNCIEFVGRGFALRSRGLETWNMYQSDIRICLRVADTFVCFGEDTTRGKCYFLLLILSLIFRINISSTSFLLFDYLYPTVYYSLRWYSRNVETILIAFQFQFMRYCWR